MIRYFCVPCKPTKANGGRTRNLPQHDPVKWSAFVAYNKRDVETEMAIQQKLSKFPVPDFLWDEYHLDQEINDRGIQLDMAVVEQATYEGVGSTKKWERIESYGPKFVENIVQAVSRDILMYAMRTLSHCFICGHVHDELIIECSMGVSLDAVCEQMGRTPPWISGLNLRADGYETMFYKKD